MSGFLRCACAAGHDSASRLGRTTCRQLHVRSSTLIEPQQVSFNFHVFNEPSFLEMSSEFSSLLSNLLKSMPVSPRPPLHLSTSSTSCASTQVLSQTPPHLILKHCLCGSSMVRNRSGLPKMDDLSAHAHLALRRENVYGDPKKSLLVAM